MADTSEKYLFLGVKQVPKDVFNTYSLKEKKQYIWFVREADHTYGIYFGNRRFANESYSETEINMLFSQKQDTLIPGTGITIVDNVISSTGGGGEPTVDTWRAVKVNGNDFLSNGTDTSALNITGGTNVNITTGNTGLVIINATDTKYTAGDFDIKNLADSDDLRSTWSSKQDALSAGQGIEITGDTINCTISDTHRSININGNSFLGNNDTVLNLSGGTNIELVGSNGTVTINCTGATINEGRNITIEQDHTINAEGYIYNSAVTSFAITGNTASGTNSFANGLSNQADGTCSHAEGRNTVASGACSHAEGWHTTAMTNYSHAEGCVTIASGIGSHAEGYATIANLDYMTAVGKYNKTGSTDEIFVVGGGTNGPGYEKNSLTVHSGGTDTVTATVNGVDDVYLGCPIGTIVMWPTNTPPENWIMCDGGSMDFYEQPINHSLVYLELTNNSVTYYRSIYIDKKYEKLIYSLGKIPASGTIKFQNDNNNYTINYILKEETTTISTNIDANNSHLYFMDLSSSTPPFSDLNFIIKCQ